MMKSTPWRIGKNSPTTPKPISSQPITSTTIRLICRSIDANNTLSYLVPRPTDVHAVVDAEGLDEIFKLAGRMTVCSQIFGEVD